MKQARAAVYLTLLWGRMYDKFFIYVPTEVARDETFPFKEGAEVILRIENKRVIIEKT